MIYRTENEWNTITSFTRRPGSIVLDMTVLDELAVEFEEIEKETKIPAKQVRRSFEENLLNSESKYLDTRIRGLILRYDSYSERVQLRKGQEQPPTPINQHQLIAKVGSGTIQLGVNVPIDQLASFPNDQIKPFLKRLKILAVNITTTDLQKDLKLLKDFVDKNLTLETKTLHLYVKLEQPEDLAMLQSELVRRGFPIEHISLSSNLFNLLLMDKPLKGSSQRLVFNYIRTYNRYLGSSFHNILEYIGTHRVIQGFGGVQEIDPLNTEKMSDNILFAIKEIEYQYAKRRAYVGGVRLPACLFINPIRIFRGDSQRYDFLHGSLQRYALEPMKRVYDGDFVGMKSTKSKEE